MRVAAKLHWFHTACTFLVSYLFVHPKRGKEALYDTVSLLKLKTLPIVLFTTVGNLTFISMTALILYVILTFYEN